MADSDLSKVIAEDYKSQNRWTTSWLIFYFILTALFLVIFFVAKDSDTKHLALIVWILTLLGFIGVFISPLTGNVGEGVPKGDALNIGKNPLKPFRGTGAASAGAEGALRVRAEMEKAAYGIQNRTLPVAIVIILNLILWLVFKEWQFALFNFVISMGMTQVQYYTQPTAAMYALK